MKEVAALPGSRDALRLEAKKGIIGATLAVLAMAAACGPVPRAFEREPAIR